MRMLLSIIVPTYNSAVFLPACLDSILNSGMPATDYEIIIVNDGSNDNSQAVAEEYSGKFSHVQVYNQNNRGLSGARNSGLAIAKGDYVWFVDADDEVDAGLLSVLSVLKERKSLDIFGVILQEVNEAKQPVKLACSQDILPHNVVLSGREAVIMGYNPSSACALIMRRGFLKENDLKFKVGITHEDVEFTYRAVAKAKAVIFSDMILYYYFRRGDTMSTPHDDARLLKYIIDDVAVAVSFKQLASQNVNDAELFQVIYKKSKDTAFGLVLSLLRNKKEWGKKGINEKVLAELKRNNLYPLKKPFYSWKKSLMAMLLNIEKILLP